MIKTTTRHAYNLIRVNITSQEGNMKQNIQNAKRWGLEYPHCKISDGIKSFINYVMWSYRNNNQKADYGQNILYTDIICMYLLLIRKRSLLFINFLNVTKKKQM